LSAITVIGAFPNFSCRRSSAGNSVMQGAHHVVIGKVVEHQRRVRHVMRALADGGHGLQDIHARESQSRRSAIGGGDRQDVLAPIGSQPLGGPAPSRGDPQERAPDVRGTCPEIGHGHPGSAHGPHHAVHGTLDRRRRRRPPVEPPQQPELCSKHPRIGRCRVHQLCAGSAGRGREGDHREGGKVPGITVPITLRP
jgi:hypothetical protein